MDISSSAPVSGTQQAASLRSNNNANTQNSPQRLEQAEAARRAQTAQTADSPRPERTAEAKRPAETRGDTYEAGGGAEVRSAQPEQRQDAAREANQTAERNAYASNARTIQVQNEVLGTTVDVVR